MTDNIILSLIIIEKLSFQNPHFWHNYLEDSKNNTRRKKDS